jgi:sugar lactone lactonase YvrE
MFEQVCAGSKAPTPLLQVDGNIGPTLVSLQFLQLFVTNGICSTATEETLFHNRTVAEESNYCEIARSNPGHPHETRDRGRVERHKVRHPPEMNE